MPTMKSQSWIPVIDHQARDLAMLAVARGAGSDMRRLVAHLQARCALPAVRKRYAAPIPVGTATPYPTDEAGYAVAFDHMADEGDFHACWHARGIVVGREVAGPPEIAGAVAAMDRTMAALGGPGAADPSGTPFVSRGFLELYHDAALADLRQSVRAYLHHVLVWGRADLWTTFDRMGLKAPGGEGAAALPLHVDQNPLVHPGFRTVQGVLALGDHPVERGTFVGAAGSRALFGEYAAIAGHGDYVELPGGHPLRAALDPRPLPLRAGDLASWDSRTTHANSANVSAVERRAAYVSGGPANPDPAALESRMQAFRSGEGANVREALMHASMRPRYTHPAALAAIRQPERLTGLGRLLYGLDPYSSVALTGPEPRSLA